MMNIINLLFLSLLMLQAGRMAGMESAFIPMDLMPAIVKYVASEDPTGSAKYDPLEEEKYVYRHNAEWTRRNKELREYKQKKYRTKIGNLHARNMMIKHYALQLVCKDFRRMFWNCFTEQEKNAVLAFLLKKDKKLIPCLVDIALSMKASMDPILGFCLRERDYYGSEDAHVMNLEYMRALLAIDNAKAVNGTYPDHLGSFLRQALFHCKDDIVELLLSCPMVDVNATNPLETAIMFKSLDIIQPFLERPDINVNTVGIGGRTPLFCIGLKYKSYTVEEFSTILDLLIKAGADSSIKDEKCATVFDVARRDWKPEFVEILEQKFAQQEKK